MRRITPHLWFDKEARQAAELYISSIPGSKLTKVTKLSGTPSGDCDLVAFELAGQPFMAISAGPYFRFNPSISFHLKCVTNDEVDAIWDRLSTGAKILMPLGSYPFSPRFGWLEDKYGLSWQVVSTAGNAVSQRITPMLMFVGPVCGKAEEAINDYASVFSNAPEGAKGETHAEVLARWGAGSEPEKEGTVQFGQCSLLGQEFVVMDSAREHNFAFNEAISFLVPCETQQEIDYFWEKLAADPNGGQCGWLKDRWGVSWQISPVVLQESLGGNDEARKARVTQAFLKMKKFDIAALERAASGT